MVSLFLQNDVVSRRNKRLSSNPGISMSEGCFIFYFASLSVEVARVGPFRSTMFRKLAVKSSIRTVMCGTETNVELKGSS